MKQTKKDQKTKQAILDSLSNIFDDLSSDDALMVEAYALVRQYNAAGVPKAAPELYLDRENRKESAVEFVRRVYVDYLGHGLGKVDLRHLDKSLYNALNVWMTKNGSLPDDIDLPTRVQKTNRQLESLKSIKSPSVRGATTSWKDVARVFFNMSWNDRGIPHLDRK